MTSKSPFRALFRATQLVNSRRPWTCSACKNGLSRPPRRGVATSLGKFKKPYYVTTPIFYVNAGTFHDKQRKLYLAN